MPALVAIAFDGPQEADRVLTELSRLQRDHLVDLEDAVIVIRQPDGKVNLKQSISLAEMSRFRGRVLRSFLSPEQEARLQAALSGGATVRG